MVLALLTSVNCKVVQYCSGHGRGKNFGALRVQINSLGLTSPSFANDFSIITLNPFFLTCCVGKCFDYS